MYLLSFLILASIATAYGQMLLPGQCENLAVVENFDVPKYAGLWYDIYHYEQINQRGLECVTANYTLNGGSVIVENSGIFNGTVFSIIGEAKLEENTTSGKLLVNFPGNVTGSPYWVLDTDYDSFALVWACRSNSNNTKFVTSWILSREPYLNPINTIRINERVKNTNDLDWSKFKTTVHWGETCIIAGSTANRAFGLLLILPLFIVKFI